MNAIGEYLGLAWLRLVVLWSRAARWLRRLAGAIEPELGGRALPARPAASIAAGGEPPTVLADEPEPPLEIDPALALRLEEIGREIAARAPHRYPRRTARRRLAPLVAICAPLVMGIIIVAFS